MDRLLKIESLSEIPKEFAGSPIGNLVEYHNLNKEFSNYSQAQLLIGMCMDNRKHLHIPDNFAFIIRSGGANLRHSEFKVSYAIAVGGVSHIALISHNHCGMVNIISRKAEFINGLVETAGWDKERAEEHFLHFAQKYHLCLLYSLPDQNLITG